MSERASQNVIASGSLLTQVLEWMTVALAVSALAWLGHGLDRGLELTDESFYLLSALHADSIRLFFSPTHWVSGALWRMAPSLVEFRAVGLGLATMSALLLAWGVLRVAPLAGLQVGSRRPGQVAVLASAASGALLYGSLLSFTPSYNLLGASGSCFAIGLGLLSISATHAGSARGLALLAGVALGITVLCKFSTGICAALLLLTLQAALTWRHPARRWDSLLMLVAMLATVVLAARSQTGFAEAQRQFGAGVELVWFAQGDKTTLARLARSAADIASMVGVMVVAFWGPVICFAVAAFWRPVLMGGIGSVWFALLLVGGDHAVAGMSRYALQAVPFAAALAMSLLIPVKQWTRSPSACLLVLTLVVLPFGIALGTGNPLQIQILTALASWGALIGLLALSSQQARLPAAFICLLFNLIVLLHIMTNGAQPYRMHALAEQTEVVTLVPLGSVKVDHQTASLVRDIQSSGQHCAIKPGRPFVDLYDLPSVALILGAVPIDSPWLLNRDYAELVLKQADPLKLKQAIVAVKLDATGTRPAPPRQLAAFPQGFRLCGRSTGPVDGLPIELWAPG